MRQLRLNPSSGSPLYLQLIEHLKHSIESGAIRPGEQLPSVRRMAEDMLINPNTVVRAYKELEIRGLLDTHHGTGTFIGNTKVERSELEHQRRLNQLVGEFVARAGAAGFTVEELLGQLNEIQAESKKKRK